MNDFKMLSSCSPYGLLACKIVEQAVLDWRKLINGKSAGHMSSMEEIRNFLKSAWCEELLAPTGVDGAWVLGKLEAEASVERGTRMLTLDGRTENVNTWCRLLAIPGWRVYKMYDIHGRAFTENAMTALKRERGL